MAFSGQYAAAQLERLDASPLFRGHTFPLAQEVAEHLGFADELVPPSYLRWSRALGRLAGITQADIIPVMMEELEGIQCVVRVSWPEVGVEDFGNHPSWIWRHAEGTTDEHCRQGRAPIIDAMIVTPQTFEDASFYIFWSLKHRNAWPRLADDTIHPALEHLVSKYLCFMGVYRDHSDRIFRMIRSRNRAILPHAESDIDMETDSDEEVDEEL